MKTYQVKTVPSPTGLVKTITVKADKFFIVENGALVFYRGEEMKFGAGSTLWASFSHGTWASVETDEDEAV